MAGIAFRWTAITAGISWEVPDSSICSHVVEQAAAGMPLWHVLDCVCMSCVKA